MSRNGYPDSLINKEIKLHSDRLKKTKSYGPQKRHVILKLPIIGKKRRMLPLLFVSSRCLFNPDCQAG